MSASVRWNGGTRCPCDGVELGALDHLADHRRDASRQCQPCLGQVGVGLDQLAAVDPQELLDRLGIGRPDMQHGVEPTGPEHGPVDLARLVGGQHHHDLGTLGDDAVDLVQDVVHLDGAFARHLAVDVLDEHDAGLVVDGELERTLQCRHPTNGDERPAVLLALLGCHRGRQRLAGAVRSLQQHAALERHVVLRQHSVCSMGVHKLVIT